MVVARRTARTACELGVPCALVSHGGIRRAICSYGRIACPFCRVGRVLAHKRTVRHRRAAWVPIAVREAEKRVTNGPKRARNDVTQPFVKRFSALGMYKLIVSRRCSMGHAGLDSLPEGCRWKPLVPWERLRWSSSSRMRLASVMLPRFDVSSRAAVTSSCRPSPRARPPTKPTCMASKGRTPNQEGTSLSWGDSRSSSPSRRVVLSPFSATSWAILSSAGEGAS